MDYRLVKQFWNRAVDAFFNFFYKIWDFVKVLVDLFWAFVDIWYQFFSFFGNLVQYVYYSVLYVVDKTTMSNNPLFFWRKVYDSKTAAPAMAYKKGAPIPAPKKYGGTGSSVISKSASTVISSVSKAAEAVKPVAAAASASSSSFSSYSAPSGKKNILKIVLSAIGDFFAAIGSGISRFFGAFSSLFSSKLKPVKAETPVGRKSLIDDYMKEYERKKNR